MYACAGSGEIDWKQLSMVVGSEMLKFEQEQAAASEAGQPGADDSHLYASPRGTLHFIVSHSAATCASALTSQQISAWFVSCCIIALLGVHCM